MSNELQQWEYFRKYVPLMEVDSELIAFGNEGWELIVYESIDTDQKLLIFKRLKLNPNDTNTNP